MNDLCFLKKHFYLVSILILMLIFLMNCAHLFRSHNPVIQIKGSDTMRILASRWAEEFMKSHPNVVIYTEASGTAKGITSLIKGEIDISTASRPIRSREASELAQKYGKLGINTLVAKDALSIYLNPENPVNDLSLNDLKLIFTGKIRNWKEVGGSDENITLFIRSPNSGTYLYFKEHVLDDESYYNKAITLPTTRAIINEISAQRNSIGYGGLAYGLNLKHCKIDGISPSYENVHNDSYPITRYLYLYTVDKPQGHVKEFIDWVLNEGQKIVDDVGFIPIW